MHDENHADKSGNDHRGGFSVADKAFADKGSHGQIDRRGENRVSEITEQSEKEGIDRNADSAENQRPRAQNKKCERRKQGAYRAHAFAGDDPRLLFLILFGFFFFVILFQGLHLPFIPVYYNIFFHIYQ